MFGIWKRKEPEVLDHQFFPVMDFETSADEYYDAIEQELAVRQLTGLDISRVEFAEGGVLSARRVYLRMRRERLLFDVCAAPFGTTYFFSYRFSQIPLQLMLWEIIVMLLVLAAVVWFYVSLFGLMLGPVLFGASFLSMLLLMRNTVRLGFQDLDAALLQIPIVGAFYEIFLRKNDTYYRQDTRLAYTSIVKSVIVAQTEEAAKAKGVDLVQFQDATPPSHPGILSMIADLLRMGR